MRAAALGEMKTMSDRRLRAAWQGRIAHPERAMRRVTLFHNKDCGRCRKIARVHRAMDWFGRVEVRTDDPPTGPLKLGEITVHDHRTGEWFVGVAAVRRLFREIPAYWPLRPLLWLPPVARKVDRDVRGCADGSCAVPVHQSN
jgi:hypothetical protein